MATRWFDYVEKELREVFPDLRAGHWNCRRISGSSIWSQHAWGNAGDLYHVAFGYSDHPEHQAFLDDVYAWILTYQEELSVRTRLWRVKDHFDHVHLDGWPKGYGTPPCAGGSNRMQYNSGQVVYGDPGPVNGTTELPDRELVQVSEAQVLEKGDDGQAVADLQEILIELGYDLGTWVPYSPEYPAGADGKYGGGTADAVTSFQTTRGLHVTGKADGVTLFFLREDSPVEGELITQHTHPFAGVTGGIG